MMNVGGNGINIGSLREIECRVCGDKASGKHYGVPSCDGCRGFFKRSIRRNLDYVCKENGCCIVDVTRRNQCQSCRFKKCLQVNMKRDAVQHERAPRTNGIGKHSTRIPFHHTNPFNSSTTQSSSIYFPLAAAAAAASIFNNTKSNSNGNFNLNSPGIIYASSPPTFVRTNPTSTSFLCSNTSRIFSPLTLTNTSHGSNLLPPPPILLSSTSIQNIDSSNLAKEKEKNSVSSDPPQSSSVEEEVSTTTQPEQSIDIYHQQHPNNLNQAFLSSSMENVYESAAKLLFLSIKWARSVPSFGNLSASDQAVLLETSWAELFILSGVQWGLYFDDSFLTGQNPTLISNARKLMDVLNRISTLNPDYTELACLKAVVLFKPEVVSYAAELRVQVLQEQTLLMLQEYCSAKIPLNKIRFGKLLLIFSTLKTISSHDLEELFFRHTVGDVTIQKLISDLIKSTF